LNLIIIIYHRLFFKKKNSLTKAIMKVMEQE